MKPVEIWMEVAKNYELELDEEFNIIGSTRLNNPHRITKIGVVDRSGNINAYYSMAITNCGLEIEKLPFIPKYDDEYWYPHPICNDCVDCAIWYDISEDHNIIKNVGVYRTKEEAQKVAKEKYGWE